MKLMHSSRVLVCVGVLAGAAFADTTKVELKQLPAAAQKTVQTELGGRSIVKIDANQRDGRARYKVVMVAQDGMQKRVTVDGDGKILRLKNDVAMRDVPAAVRKTAEANASGAKLVRSTKVTHDDVTEWEVEYDVKGRSKQLLMGTDGKLERIEEVVLAASLPAKAKAGIEKEVGTNKLIKIVAVTFTGKPTTYDAQFEKGDGKAEIQVAGDGKVLERE
jgi:hypothetical protein